MNRRSVSKGAAFVLAFLIALTAACSDSSDSTSTSTSELANTTTTTETTTTETTTTETTTSVPPASTTTSRPVGKTVVVTSAADGGPGSLRQVLTAAESGDVIVFDSVVFPPEDPAVIMLASGLPPISEDYLTLDASNAGVILDGSGVDAGGTFGIEINSSYGVIRGLQVVDFPGPALILGQGSRFNVIGGDRSVGSGPIGEGNLFSSSLAGVMVFGSDNVIAGNLIGTDATGLESLGNHLQGVSLQYGASRNVIGPNNTIAFNGTEDPSAGVEIRGVSPLANVITTNSIHDNSSAGIERWALRGPVPVILGVDLAIWSVEGLACPGCTVEIFSTERADGEHYEGTAEADQFGGFSLSGGRAFSGPALTATLRSSDGNTSPFSAPTFGSLEPAVLQTGNDKPKGLIESKSVAELAGNYIGTPWDGYTLDSRSDCPLEDDRTFAETAELGFKTVRVSPDFLEFETAKGQGAYSRFEFSPCLDPLLSLYADNGVTVVFTIVYWDEGLGFRRPPDYRNDDEVDSYLEYVRFIVRRFGDRVQYFEILNEGFHYVEVEDYIDLVRKAEQVIHQESPTSRVVAGGVAHLDIPYFRDYLFTLLRSDVMPLIDAINLHPMYGTSPGFADTRQYYYDYPEIISEIKNEAEAHGFTGEYIAEEMIWRTSANLVPHDTRQYTEPVAAKYFARAIVINRGLDLWAGIALESIEKQPLIAQTVHHLNNVMDGVEPEPLIVLIESEATNIASYAFATANGERLIALWTDGSAVDYDPGVTATLTFPGFAAQEATGIDVVVGYQQPLILESRNGDLVIRSITVRDYPVFIRLKP